MFPNKASDAWVFWDCLESAFIVFISRLWAFDSNVVDHDSNCVWNRARHESGYLRRYLRVHPWENPCKRITRVRVTRRLQNPRVRVSVLDHTQPVRVTRTTRVYFSKHSRATTTTRRMGSFKNEVG